MLGIFFHEMFSSRKYPYSPHRRDWNFLGGGGSVRPKNLKKCMKLNRNFQRGGGGMDIFWNYIQSALPFSPTIQPYHSVNN